MAQALLEASLNLPLLARGKVRDIYATDARDPHSPLLFIATDRISAFDHVLGSPIPEKGRILTQLSLFWFHFLAEIVPNHLISADVATFPPILAQTRKTDGEIETIETSDNAISLPPALAGRTMLVKRAQMFPVECVVRGYLSGSGWKDYQATSASGQPSVCGVALPRGLRESDRLPEPIFTPAAKINTGGHDENISFASVVQTIGEEYANRLRELSLSIYARASAHAASKGVILADTKFEFGIVPGPGGTPQITLADEVLLRIPHATGRSTNTNRVVPHLRSTSNMSATIWNRYTGTSRCPRPPCRMTSSQRRATNTCRRTSCSRAAPSFNYSKHP
jgi:phosphoribosylaminoimidazole-succinocarboxamide synthase